MPRTIAHRVRATMEHLRCSEAEAREWLALVDAGLIDVVADDGRGKLIPYCDNELPADWTPIPPAGQVTGLMEDRDR